MQIIPREELQGGDESPRTCFSSHVWVFPTWLISEIKAIASCGKNIIIEESSNLRTASIDELLHSVDEL